MAYTTDEKSTGLDVLTTLDQSDLHIVGDVSDTGRAKAITEDNLEDTIAGSTNFVNGLIGNTTFTTNLAGDTNFINNLTGNPLFQTNVNNFVSAAGGGGGTKLAIDTTDVNITGTTAETTIYQIPIPANTLGTNNAVRFKIIGSSDPAGGTTDIRFKYGATTVATISSGWTPGASRSFEIYGFLIADAATNAQKGYLVISSDNRTNNEVIALGSSAEDSTGTLNLTVTFQSNDAASSMDAEAIVVEKISTGSNSIATYYSRPLLPAIFSTSNAYQLNTEMRIGVINIPQTITVSSITYEVTSHTTTGTLQFVMYSEDGQTIIFDEVSSSITTIGTFTDSITPVTITAGNYYLGAHSNGTTDVSLRKLAIATGAASFNPVGGPVQNGIVTITASTTPATIDPTADITPDQDYLAVILS